MNFVSIATIVFLNNERKVANAMKKIKKLISILLICTLVSGFCFSLSACGSKNEETGKEQITESTKPTVDTEKPTGENNTTQPSETLPNSTQPSETLPNDTEPSETVPNETKPDNTPTENTTPSGENKENGSNNNDETKPPESNNNNDRPVVNDDILPPRPQGGGANGNNGTGNSTTTGGNGNNQGTGNNGDNNTKPSAKDETVFTSYETFYNQSVASGNHVFAKEPTIKDLTSKCDCKITFSGSLRSGSISVETGGQSLGHAHGWNTPMEAKPDVIVDACDECGFTKGANFIYVKIKGKDHGHGWSWPIEIQSNIPDSCACGYRLTGNYENGTVSIKLNGQEHTHVWATGHSATNNHIAYNSNGVIHTQSPTFLMPPPQCFECMFFKYAQSGVGYIRIKCGLDENKDHVMTYNLTPESQTHESNCSCGFTFSGNLSNGSYSLKIDNVGHMHAWAVNQSVGGSTSNQNMLDKINCKICNFARTQSGFRIICPDTGLLHMVNFAALSQ